MSYFFSFSARSFFLRSFRLAGGCVVLWMTMGCLRAQIPYDDGSMINLATVRGADATASGNLQGPPAYHPASFLLHPSYGALRFDSHFRSCWWMLELPAAYNVSKVRLIFEGVKSMALQIKVATDPPEDWDTVPAAASFKGPVPHSDPGDPNRAVALIEFAPVKAKFIRIEIRGHNGGEDGLPVTGDVLQFTNFAAWGPNNPAISPAISAAQSIWAGGQCTVYDATMDTKGGDGKIVQGIAQDASGAIDDNNPSNNGGAHSVDYWVPGSPNPAIDQTAQSSSFFVTLKNRMKISEVAYSAIDSSRQERPRDVKVYTSPLDKGDSDWTLQKTLTDVGGGEYVEIPFDQPVQAKRVRFEIGRVWSTNIDPGNKLSRGIMAQFYVYGDALPPDFTYTAPAGGGQTGIQVFDKQGMPIRTMQLPDTIKPGTYGVVWDGTDNLGTKMPPGDYECRVILNPAIYSTPGAIGNTSITMGTQDPQVLGKENPSDIDSVVADANGDLYTADSWDEAGQDFRKWDRETGGYLLDGQYGIRNGTPNGLPYALAIDDKYIYCSTFAIPGYQALVRRFNITDAKLAPFPKGPNISDGHILIHVDSRKEIPKGTPDAEAAMMSTPLKSLAVAGGKIFVSDCLSNKVWIFDSSSGAPGGSFDVKLPFALAVDSSGRLWVSHEHGKVSVFSPDGKPVGDVLKDLGDIVALAFGPDHTLYVADRGAGKVLIYKVDEASLSAVQQRTFGQPAKPGDYAPDQFYQLKGVAVDAKGYLTVAQNLTVSGCRMTRFAPDGKVVWDQVSGEFCTNGNYSQDRPDDIISQYFHHYKIDKKTGKFQFVGCVVATDPKYINGQHSPMRLLKLNGQEFAFMSYGNGMQVYRRKGELFSLCSMWGSSDPIPDGTQVDAIAEGLPRPPAGLYSWHDANGNGKIDAEEIAWQIKPGDPVNGFGNMGVNADDHGNCLFGSYEGDVKEVPMTGFDKLGNPMFDMSQVRTLIPHDPSPKAVLFSPKMAIRADDGSIYVDFRSQVYPAPPEAGFGWMTGWMLARYDKDGKKLWYTRMPDTCTGMDYVPGGGVMLITIQMEPRGTPIYHYSSDGALIGIAYPSQKVLGFSANTDNTGALSVSRDPRDGILDMFSEDCVGNRFRWQRADDHVKPRVITTWVRLREAGQPLQVVSAPAK